MRPRATVDSADHTSRRHILLTVPALCASQLVIADASWSFSSPPPGFSRHMDRLDGYSFFYPEAWSVVTTSGNDVFYRNVRIADQNVFVDISSPSSSKYDSVADLGPPEKAAEKVEKQLLTEFMSTRLGVQREVENVSATSRTGDDGKEYYDIVTRIRSYASRQQLAVSDKQRQDAVVLEFDRVLYTTLGTANQRLYEFRVQGPYARVGKDAPLYDAMARSFQCKEVA